MYYMLVTGFDLLSDCKSGCVVKRVRSFMLILFYIFPCGADFCSAVIPTCYILHKMTQHSIYTPPVKCEFPIKIRNKYTGDWLLVPCRKCDVCRINAANTKCYHLANELDKYPFLLFVTLTYDNAHLPYVSYGGSTVMRGFDVPEFIGYLPVKCDVHFQPVNHPVKDITGVLIRSDYQKFFKKLRINYERKIGGKFPWSYHLIGEYGTISKRPHFHFVLFGKTIFPENIRNCIIESWQMCDWDRLDLDKTFENATTGLSSYLSSYLNCFADSSGFLNDKTVKTFCVRSKNLDFGSDKDLRTKFESAVKNGFSNEQIARFGFPVTGIDCSKKGSVSDVLLPKKYISSLFSLPVGLYKDITINKYRGFERVVESSKNELINSDYFSRLSYEKYLKLRGVTDSVAVRMFFLNDAFTYRNMYASQVLKYSMLEYNYLNPSDYFSRSVNTLLDDSNKRSFKLQIRGVDADLDYLQADYTPFFNDYKYLYGKKLLTKHLNEL